MEYQEYVNGRKNFYDHFICFLNEENQNEECFNQLIENINKFKYQENPEEFKFILHLILHLSKISNNHQRTPTLFPKIEQILSHYKEYLKESFSNQELFDVFAKSPRVLYYLFKQEILSANESIIELFLNNDKKTFSFRQYKNETDAGLSLKEQKFFKKKLYLQNYKYYFYSFIRSKLKPEEQSQIESELIKIDDNIFDNFDQKCQIGENDSYISKLIREDSVEEFVAFMNRSNIPLSSKIKSSIFETNPLLHQYGANLIEYAAFFGSIQIFNYLRMSGVELTGSLWIYAIHGSNTEIIHILEDCHVDPEDSTYFECLKESIKCHHNNIARYIEENLLKEKIGMSIDNFKNTGVCCGFHYFNYEFIQNTECTQNMQYILYYASLFDHLPIVKLLFKTKEADINQTIILASFFIMLNSSFRPQVLNTI